jgi:hypothetical protein
MVITRAGTIRSTVIGFGIIIITPIANMVTVATAGTMAVIMAAA